MILNLLQWMEKDDEEEGASDLSDTEVGESLYGKGGILSGFASGIPKVESESRVGVFIASVKAEFNNMSKCIGTLSVIKVTAIMNEHSSPLALLHVPKRIVMRSVVSFSSV